mmetsp:Transcript_44444/g.117976  ORF Transcript_44444/g.117976 Transcript_44444/m.117976 type:complete len:230 (+) Transcript_44444:143-832(+)
MPTPLGISLGCRSHYNQRVPATAVGHQASFAVAPRSLCDHRVSRRFHPLATHDIDERLYHRGCPRRKAGTTGRCPSPNTPQARAKRGNSPQSHALAPRTCGDDATGTADTRFDRPRAGPHPFRSACEPSCRRRASGRTAPSSFPPDLVPTVGRHTCPWISRPSPSGWRGTRATEDTSSPPVCPRTAARAAQSQHIQVPSALSPVEVAVLREDWLRKSATANANCTTSCR